MGKKDLKKNSKLNGREENQKEKRQIKIGNARDIRGQKKIDKTRLRIDYKKLGDEASKRPLKIYTRHKYRNQ